MMKCEPQNYHICWQKLHWPFSIWYCWTCIGIWNNTACPRKIPWRGAREVNNRLTGLPVNFICSPSKFNLPIAKNCPLSKLSWPQKNEHHNYLKIGSLDIIQQTLRMGKSHRNHKIYIIIKGQFLFSQIWAKIDGNFRMCLKNQVILLTIWCELSISPSKNKNKTKKPHYLG